VLIRNFGCKDADDRKQQSDQLKTPPFTRFTAEERGIGWLRDAAALSKLSNSRQMSPGWKEFSRVLGTPPGLYVTNCCLVLIKPQGMPQKLYKTFAISNTSNRVWNIYLPTWNLSTYLWIRIYIFILSRVRVSIDGYWIDNRIYCTLQSSTTESLRTPSALQFTTEYITITLQSLYPPQPLSWHPLPTLPWLLPNSRFPSFLPWLHSSLTHWVSEWFTTDNQSVSASWFRAPFGAHDQMLITVCIYCFVDIGRPLWREVGSFICLSHLNCFSPVQ
jgi:hypothetical protein